MTQATRVCVVGAGFRFTSGISYYTHRLTTEFAQDHPTSAILVRRLVPRRLYPGRDRVGQAVHDVRYGDTIPVYDGIDWYWGSSMLGAVRFLRKERPDVVILQWWTGAVLHSYLALAAAARSIGADLIIEFHEIQDTGEAAVRGAGAYLARVGRALIRRADAYVVHSEFDRAQVQEHFPLRGKPVRVVQHGPFDHHVSAPVATGAQPQSSGRIRVLFFGTIRPYKGLETLIRAFDSVDDAAAAALELVVVGETWEGWTLPLELVAASPRRDQITVVNRYVRDDEVAAFFRGADVVALPYTRSSASGPLHIAMAYGHPIILSDVGGLRDGAADYAGVTWVPPDDVTALADALRAAPSTVGRPFADPRSWSASVMAYDELFAQIRRR